LARAARQRAHAYRVAQRLLVVGRRFLHLTQRLVSEADVAVRDELAWRAG